MSKTNNDNGGEVAFLKTSIADWIGYKPSPEPKREQPKPAPRADFRLVQIGRGVVAVPLRSRR